MIHMDVARRSVMEDLKRSVSKRDYEVDVDAVARSIARQLLYDRMWIKYPRIGPLGPGEVLESTQSEDLTPTADKP